MSVKNCAENIYATNDQIDVFIFNAGVMAPPYLMTENGFESQFQVNYLSHYYLFSWLKDLLLKGELKKVISISSLSSEKGVNGTIADFERDSGCEKNAYNAMKCYRESKFAQILFTAELHNRFSKEGLKSYAVHPGVVNTNLFYRQTNALAKALIQPIAWLGYATGFLKTPEKGAETTVYLATNEVQESGLYWADKKIRKHNHLADNQKFLTAFWEWSAEIAEHSIQSNQSNPAFSGHGECPDWEIDAFSQS
jgi:NAD(P)-dependent dehydrogenase (short-subunit alcohol dehydrogenase family)